MAATGENYTTTATRATDAGAQAGPVTALKIDPQLLVPYPDELVRAASAGEEAPDLGS